ncbi:MAG: DNA repair protein RadC [Cytophagaceae bacterium]
MENQISPFKPGRITSWAEDDRPREKLALKGTAALSDAELIAILLGSGTRELSALDLAKEILYHSQNNLHELARKSIPDLCKHKGIGEAKAITLVAALEIGKRRKEVEGIDRLQIKTSQEVYQYFAGDLMDLPHEEFWVLLLNRKNKIIKPIKISSGGVSGTVADPKLIFKYALEHLASSIILVHNHPSGNPNPSDADIQLTKRMVQAGNLMETPVLDHIIIAHKNWYSFADEGKI